MKKNIGKKYDQEKLAKLEKAMNRLKAAEKRMDMARKQFDKGSKKKKKASGDYQGPEHATSGEGVPAPAGHPADWKPLIRGSGASSSSLGTDILLGPAAKKAGQVVGGAMGGAVGGPGGATVGAVVGGVVAGSSLSYGGKQLANWAMGVEPAKPNKKFLAAIKKEEERKDSDAVIAGTLAGVSQVLMNAAQGNEFVGRVAHADVATLRGMMNPGQLTFLNSVIAAQPAFGPAGMTVVGDPRGSFYGYLARMILTDEGRARDLLEPLIALPILTKSQTTQHTT